jgi:hypothetical protein
MTASKRRARPPQGLSPNARGWFQRLTAEYQLDDAAGLLVLEQAMRSFDRAEAARRVLDKEGLTTTDSRGRPKAHPAAAVERDARSGLLAALKSLNFDLEPVRDRTGRPPGR